MRIPGAAAGGVTVKGTALTAAHNSGGGHHVPPPHDNRAHAAGAACRGIRGAPDLTGISGGKKERGISRTRKNLTPRHAAHSKKLWRADYRAALAISTTLAKSSLW